MSSRRRSGTSIHPSPASQSSHFLLSSPNISTYSGTISTCSIPTKIPSSRSYFSSAGNFPTLYQLCQRHSNYPISLTHHQTHATFDPMPASQHDRRERKGRFDLLCDWYGRPGADLRNGREILSESFKQRTSLGQVFLPSLFADQVVLLRLQRTASRIRTDEIAGMGKLTAGHRFAAVVIFPS